MTWARVVAAALLAAILAGCAGAGTTGSAVRPGADRPSPNPSPTAETSLSIRLLPGAGAKPRSWTLTCDPPGGTHPHPWAACDTLAHAQDPFAPVPDATVCIQTYGGPQTATIDGVWRGQQVHASYSRVDGCQIARWEVLAPVLQPARDGGATGRGLPPSGTRGWHDREDPPSHHAVDR